jgi:hypothetical protein
LHACKANTGAAAGSCKLQHVAQLQLQQGALILKPQLLLPALLQDENIPTHAGADTNATETPVAAHNQHTTGATTTSSSSNSTNADSTAVTLHMAACCVNQDSSSATTSNCLAGTAPTQPPAARDNTSSALQDEQQQQQQDQQQQWHDQQLAWTNTVALTISEQQQTCQRNIAAAGCPPGVEAWEVATPVLLPTASAAAAHVSLLDAAQDVHVPAVAASQNNGDAVSKEAEDGLKDSSSSNNK